MNDEQPLQKVAGTADCAAIGMACTPPATELSWGAVAWESVDAREVVFRPYVASRPEHVNAAARAAGLMQLRLSPGSRFVIPTSPGAWFAIAAVVAILAGFASTFAGPMPALSGLVVIAFLVGVPVMVPKKLRQIGWENVASLHPNDLVAWRVQERILTGHDPAPLVAVLRDYAFTTMDQDEALALVEQN